MTTAETINKRIMHAFHCAYYSHQKIRGCAPIFIRMWLKPETVIVLLENTNYKPGHKLHYSGIVVSRCLPGDPGERIIDMNGNAYLIPQEA